MVGNGHPRWMTVTASPATAARDRTRPTARLVHPPRLTCGYVVTAVRSPQGPAPTTCRHRVMSHRAIAPPAGTRARRPIGALRCQWSGPRSSSVGAPHTAHRARRHPIRGRDGRTSPHPGGRAPTASARSLPYAVRVGNSLPLERTSRDRVTCFTKLAPTPDGVPPPRGAASRGVRRRGRRRDPGVDEGRRGSVRSKGMAARNHVTSFGPRPPARCRRRGGKDRGTQSQGVVRAAHRTCR